VRLPVPTLHAITNQEILQRPDFISQAAALAAAGEMALHIRSPETPGRALHELAVAVGSAAPAAAVIVNDRVDVAVLAAASGVHLPEQGLPIEGTRRLLGPEPWIGRSVHSAAAARAATAEGADYVLLGPIWETPSHPGRAGIGPDAIAEARPARVIAIGGVTPERVAACLGAGAYGVAAISALWASSDPRSAAHTMLLSLSPNT
jgi:thiamine-phosphate pyrophosphorylase